VESFKKIFNYSSGFHTDDGCSRHLCHNNCKHKTLKSRINVCLDILFRQIGRNNYLTSFWPLKTVCNHGTNILKLIIVKVEFCSETFDAYNKKISSWRKTWILISFFLNLEQATSSPSWRFLPTGKVLPEQCCNKTHKLYLWRTLLTHV